MKRCRDIELVEAIFFEDAFNRFDAHGVQNVGRRFDAFDLAHRELKPTRLVPIQFVVDGVVGETDAFDFGLPIVARTASDAFHYDPLENEEPVRPKPPCETDEEREAELGAKPEWVPELTCELVPEELEICELEDGATLERPHPPHGIGM